MMDRKILIAGAALCAVLSCTVEAKLYKWVDDKGVTHFGDTIPPEYANTDTKQMSKSGRVTDRDDGFSSEKQRAGKDTAAEKAALEARRRDDALLNTYSSEKEIDLARDRNLLQVEARVNSFSTMLKSAQATHDDLLQEQANLTKQSRKIPASLTEDIAASESRLAKLQKDLDLNMKEMDAVKARYEADKLRYRELKGLRPQ